MFICFIDVSNIFHIDVYFKGRNNVESFTDIN